MYRENQQSGSFILHIELWPAFSASVFEDIFHSLVYIVSAFVKKKMVNYKCRDLFLNLLHFFNVCFIPVPVAIAS